VYGGAGVHVAELSAVLREHLDVRVRCFDGARTEAGVTGYDVPAELADRDAVLRTFGVDLLMAGDVAGADLVHSHTWYANLAGHLAGLLHGIPHVISAHSLEPLRPWKAEQLGGGYALSGWAEKTAYEGAAAIIAVSAGMRADILRSYPDVDPARVHVVHNGIDLDGWRRPDGAEAVAAAHATARSHGIDPDRPAVVFVGRITRQKGLPYLLRAAEALPPEVQLVLCAGAPDTAEIMAEVTGLVAELRTKRDGVVWIEEMLPRPTGRPGRRFSDARTMVEGIVYRYRTGIAWRDLPEVFGPWQTVWTWHRRMAFDGTWDRAAAKIVAAADAAGMVDWSLSVDSTIARAHQHATNTTRLTGGWIELQGFDARAA